MDKPGGAHGRWRHLAGNRGTSSPDPPQRMMMVLMGDELEMPCTRHPATVVPKSEKSKV